MIAFVNCKVSTVCVCVCTYSTKRVLQLQSEGSEGDVLRPRQERHGGQVRRRVAGIPLAGGGVEGKTSSCRAERWFSH